MSPIETILVAAVSALAGVIAWLYKSQEAARSAAHAETRGRLTAMQGRIDEMDGHVEECNQDRETLRVRVGILEDRETRKAVCPKTDCPLRLP